MSGYRGLKWSLVWNRLFVLLLLWLGSFFLRGFQLCRLRFFRYHLNLLGLLLWQWGLDQMCHLSSFWFYGHTRHA